MTRNGWTVLGKNDEVTTCECCGKSNLKLTVVMTNGEGEVRYGRDCAARLLAGQFGRMTALRVQRIAENAEYEREKAERMKTRLAITNF